MSRAAIFPSAFVLTLSAIFGIPSLPAMEPDIPGGPVTPARAVLLAIWQKEHLSGKRAEAAEEYEQLYSRGRAPSPAVEEGRSQRTAGSVLRIRAAYRAGRAFEALGNSARAVLAYEWLVEAFDRLSIEIHDPDKSGRDAFASLRVLRDRANVRLATLKPTRTDSTFAAQPILEVLDGFSKVTDRDSLVVERIRQELFERRRRVSAGRSRVTEFERGGGTLRFPRGLAHFASNETGAEDILAKVCENAWSGEEVAELVEGIRAREILRALRSAGDDDHKEARSAALRAVWLSQAGSYAAEILEKIDSPSGRTLPSVWRAELDAFVKRRVAVRRRGVRVHLLQSDGFERGDRALRKVLEAYRALSFGGEEESRDIDLSTIRDTARLRAKQHAGTARAADVGTLLDRLDASVDRVVELAGDLVRVSTEEHVLGGVPRVEFYAGAANSTLRGRLAGRVVEAEQELRDEVEARSLERKWLSAELAAYKHTLLRLWFPDLLEHVSTVDIVKGAAPRKGER